MIAPSQEPQPSARSKTLIVANKAPGMRAAQCHDIDAAKHVSKSDNTQITTSGERVPGPEGTVEAEIIRTPLLSDRDLLIRPKDHPLAKKKRVTWKDLEDYRFISQTRYFTARLVLDLNMWSNKRMLKPVHDVSYVTTTLVMVAANIGIAACPSYAAPRARACQLERRPIYDPEFILDVCIFTTRGTSLSPAAESFISFRHRFVEKK